MPRSRAGHYSRATPTLISVIEADASRILISCMALLSSPRSSRRSFSRLSKAASASWESGQFPAVEQSLLLRRLQESKGEDKGGEEGHDDPEHCEEAAASSPCSLVV